MLFDLIRTKIKTSKVIFMVRLALPCDVHVVLGASFSSPDHTAVGGFALVSISSPVGGFCK
jgi:hypothetical protein